MVRFDAFRKARTPVFAFLAVVLSGCGAINSAINARIQPAVNPFGLDFQTVDVAVGGAGSGLSGSGERAVAFADQSVSEAGRLRFVRFSQGLRSTIMVTAPQGAPLPAQFSVSSMTLTVTFRDDAPRSVSADRTRTGPITFVRVGETNEYQTTDSLDFSDLEIRSNFGTFRDIYTMSPSPNDSRITISLQSDGSPLPAGSTLRFTLVGSVARFGV
ncbi:MAG: hypothetical protein V4671_31745 [Armatimonadota bacterium]